MRKLISFAVGYTVGYLLVTKLAPVVQAHFEAMDLDTMWDVYDSMPDWGKPQ